MTTTNDKFVTKKMTKIAYTGLLVANFQYFIM